VSIGDDLPAVSAIRNDAAGELVSRAYAILRDLQGKRLGGGQTSAKLIEQVQDDAFLHEHFGIGYFAVVRGAQPQYTVQPVLFPALLRFIIYPHVVQPQGQLNSNEKL